MAVDLEFYSIDEASGAKTKLNDVYGFGNLFKGTQKRVPITIFNNGDSPILYLAKW